MTVIYLPLAAAFALIVLGLYCLTTKRNMIKLIIGVEITTNGSTISLVVFASQRSLGFIDPVVQSLAIMAIAIGGCIAAVGLSLAIQAYRQYKTLDISELKRLRY